MIAHLYLLQANCQPTGRLWKAARKYVVSLKQPRCHLFAKVAKLIRIILLALGCCLPLMFSCCQVVFLVLWVSSSTFLFNIKSWLRQCMLSLAGGRTDALQLTKIAEELISSNAGHRSLLETVLRQKSHLIKLPVDHD